MRINERQAAINGVPAAQHIGRSVREVIPGLAPGLDPLFYGVLHTGETTPEILIHGVTPAQPGEELDWIASYSPLAGPEGEIRGVIASIADVTARVRAERALRARESQLSAIYDNAHDVIFAVAVEPQDRFRFTSINRRFLAATGLREEEVIGRLVTEIIPEPSHALVLAKYREAIRNRLPVHWEETSDYPAGRKVGHVAVAPVFDADGRATMS